MQIGRNHSMSAGCAAAPRHLHHGDRGTRKRVQQKIKESFKATSKNPDGPENLRTST